MKATAAERGRSAIARSDWREAYEAFAQADLAELDGPDLTHFADAAWWVSEPTAAIGLRHHAYAAYSAAGLDVPAAGVAARLALEHAARGQASVAGGWLARAYRNLDGPPESPVSVFVWIVDGALRVFAGDIDGSLELTHRAVDLARRFGDRDLLALAIHQEGLTTISAGQVTSGFTLLDDAMTSVLAGELSPFITGLVFCNVIEACLGSLDLRRAGEWAAAAREWCETLPPDAPYPRICRVNRAQIARFTGHWDEAESEATLAAEAPGEPEPWEAGLACYQVGEIRRLRGDLPGAERWFARARESGRDPQPGLALVRMARGDVRAAATVLSLELEAQHPITEQAWLLLARVEIALAAEQLQDATSACDTLDALSSASEISALGAIAATARGVFLMAAGEPHAALQLLPRALAGWLDLGMPFETAQVRRTIGVALRAVGADEDGGAELRAALSVFRRLRAEPDVATTVRLLGDRAELPRGLTSREVEVLSLVADGLTNRDIGVQLVISEHTVSRHLQNIYAKIGVSTRAAAAAFATAHGLA